MRINRIAADTTSQAIGTRLRSSFEALSAVRNRTEEHLAAITLNRQAQRNDLNNLGELLQSTLRERGEEIDGIGIATTAGYLEDSQYWIEWWRFDNQHDVEFVAHSLNPSRDVFYDYADLEWFTRPLNSRGTSVTGPFVDFGGTNTSTVTLALPVIVNEACVAIAGADIHTSRFETYFLPSSSDTNATDAPHTSTLLVNSDNRVIATNNAAYLPGDLIDSRDFASWTSSAIEVGMPTSIGWRLLVESTKII